MSGKLAILLAVLLAGMSCVFLLPKQLGYQPVGVKMEHAQDPKNSHPVLPDYLGGWFGKETEVTDKEKGVLVGSDFARKTYTNARGDRVLVSIILSGQDMMTGIHRPERCLQAQGWNAESSARRTILLSNKKPLPVTRLLNSQVVVVDGKSYPVGNVAYYWFIGATRQTPSHGARIFYDSVDRIVKGYNQRWAMVLVSAEVTKSLGAAGRSERETEHIVEDVISRLGPKILTETVKE